MQNQNLPYLLPLRCVIFLLVFVAGAFATNQKVDEISNWWSVVASVVNVVTILILLVIVRKQKSNYWKLISVC